MWHIWLALGLFQGCSSALTLLLLVVWLGLVSPGWAEPEEASAVSQIDWRKILADQLKATEFLDLEWNVKREIAPRPSLVPHYRKRIEELEQQDLDARFCHSCCCG